MADGEDGGGSAFPIVVGVAVLLALATGGATTTTSESTTSSGSTSTTTSSSSTVVTSSTTTAPGALSSCPGRVVRERTDNSITLRLYYDAQAKGVNCVAAVHNGAVTATGYLQTELRFASYAGTSWPGYASQAGKAGVANVSGIYLVATNDRCVTAVATYYPSGPGGTSSSVSMTRIACG
ncbi:MAG: hypothetical protein ABJA74_01945 [Lapillicoccus sp.]